MVQDILIATSERVSDVTHQEAAYNWRQRGFLSEVDGRRAVLFADAEAKVTGKDEVLILGDTEWRFVSPRLRAGTDHLEGYDPAKSPVVVKSDFIETAALDYYDGYWTDFWQRLRDKYPDAK